MICVALAAVLVACSDDETPRPTRTVPAAEPTERVFPTATPLPAEVLNDGCPVTEPNGSTPPGEDANRYHHGNGSIWVALWPSGTIVFEPEGPGARSDLDGTLAMKFPWWRDVEGRLEIQGRRLDAEAAPMWGEVSEGYGNTGVQVTGLVFPTEGCWEVTGRVGESSLTFVTRVVSLYPPFRRYEVGEVTLASCPVTEPNGVLPPDDETQLAYGSGGVSTRLWPGGRVVVSPDGAGELRDDGSLAVEWWWLLWTEGRLEVTGRRLDQAGAALRFEGEDYTLGGVQRSILVFPEPGCWEVTARNQDSGFGMVFVTLVESNY